MYEYALAAQLGISCEQEGSGKEFTVKHYQMTENEVSK